MELAEDAHVWRRWTDRFDRLTLPSNNGVVGWLVACC